MGILRPILSPLVRPMYPPIAEGMPWEGAGGGSPLVAPGAPTISGAVTIGGTLTIVANAQPGVPVGTYVLFRDGVSAGVVVSGYTYVAADAGPSLTVKATNAVGTSAASNALQLTWAAMEAQLTNVRAVFDERGHTNPSASNLTPWVNQKLLAFGDMSAAAGQEPQTGRTMNSLAIVDFPGTDERFATAGLVSAFAPATQYEIVVTGILDAVVGTGTDIRDNEDFYTDAVGVLAMGARKNGSVYTVGAGHIELVGATYKQVEDVVTLGAPFIAHTWYDGTTIHLRTDGNAEVTIAATEAMVGGNPLHFGSNYNNARILNGGLATILAFDATTAGKRADLRALLAYKWGVTT